MSAKASRFNLILIANALVNHAPSFQKIKKFLREEAPDIRVYIIDDRRHRLIRLLAATRPTFIFSPVEVNRFQPVRGKLFCGSDLSKSAEYTAMAAANISIPRYELLTPANPKPDVTHLGKYIVVKPDRGARGANVRIMKSNRARWEPGKNTIGQTDDALIAQEFIYTGPWPICHRVTTLFGKVIWAVTWEADHARAPLENADSVDKTGGGTIVASSKRCTGQLLYDEEILRFGEAAHAAFPTIPLIGLDIVQRADDKKLFVVEANASGWVWHFNSPMGLKFQSDFNVNLESQFDGLRKAAQILADQTRALAI